MLFNDALLTENDGTFGIEFDQSFEDVNYIAASRHHKTIPATLIIVLGSKNNGIN